MKKEKIHPGQFLFPVCDRHDTATIALQKIQVNVKYKHHKIKIQFKFYVVEASMYQNDRSTFHGHN